MFKKYRKSDFFEPYTPSFTVPDQTFTPRQIIEQFASGEIVAMQHKATDEFYDDKMSDDDLVDKVVDVEDEFQARQFVLDFRLAQDETQTSNSVREGSFNGAPEATNGVSDTSGVESIEESSAEGFTAS